MTTETNAERLQQIKQNHEGLVAYTADIGSDVINLPRINSDMAFLIELVQEMEKSIKGFAVAVEVYSEMPVDEAMKQLIDIVQEDSQ